jgi:hypothetical protein
VGKLALASLTTGAKAAHSATIGGMPVAKLGALSAVAASVLVAGGVVICTALGQSAAPATVIAPAPNPTGVPLSGKVLRPDGQPAEGAAVALYYCHETCGYGSQILGEATMDAQGRFTVFHPEFERPQIFLQVVPVDRLLLVATHKDHALDFAEVAEGQQTGYEIKLRTGEDLRINVVDTQGLPVPSAEVRVLSQGDFGCAREPYAQGMASAVSEAFCRARTGADGSVLVRQTLPSTNLTVHVVHKEKGEAYASVRNKEAQVSLQPRQRLSGRVTHEPENEPAPGVIVSAGRLGERCWAKTGEDGRYEIHIPQDKPTNTAPKDKTIRLTAQAPTTDSPWAATTVTAPLEDEKPIQLDIAMRRGTLVSGRAVNADTGEPLAGAVVGSGMRDSSQPLHMYHLTGAGGNFQFRTAQDNDDFGVVHPPQGFVLTSRWRPNERISVRKDTRPEVNTDLRDVEVKASLARRGPVIDLLVKGADGTPAQGARILVLGNGSDACMGRTDAQGHVRLAGLTEGQTGPMRVESADRKIAALVNLPAQPAGNARQMVVQLQSTRTLTVRLADADGTPLSGRVHVSVPVGSRTRTQMGDAVIPADAREKVGRIEGLAPETDYLVQGFVPNRTQVDGDRLYHLAANDPDPSVTLHFRPQDNGRIPEPAQDIPPEEKFREQLRGLDAAAWRKADAVDKNLTWYGLTDGVAVANAAAKEARRYSELLGEKGLIPSAIAFGGDKVWLGTNKGLFAYDRKAQFWTRFAVGGKTVAAAVKDLSLSPQGTLSVTVETDGKAAQRFEYNTAMGEWQRD